MRRVSTWLVGIALAVFLLGASVAPLTIPSFTRIVASRTSLFQEAGLSKAAILGVAENVRVFVVDGDGQTLPSTVEGRPGFDESAVSHLLDVRRVLAGARIATGVLALGLTLGLAYEVARKRTDVIADALMAGAVCSVALVVLCAVAATSDFGAFFAAFHGLFFSAGTWTFPYDSLLIQTFPEKFWIAGARPGRGSCSLGRACSRSADGPFAGALRGLRIRLPIAHHDACSGSRRDKGSVFGKTLVSEARTSAFVRGLQFATATPARVCGRCYDRFVKEVTARMAAKEGYCVKCKAKKDIVDPQDITMKNGRPATQGTCPDCGTKIFKIGKS